jgi:hypothetical protein
MKTMKYDYKLRPDREQIILDIKTIMKELATINLDISDMNKNWINDANDYLKTLCEMIDF